MSSENDDGGQDRTLKAAVRTVALAGVAMAVVAALVADLRFGAGVLIGGIIAVVNLIVLARVVQAFLDKKGNTAPWAIIAVLKLVFLLGGIYLLLKSDKFPVLSLAIGYMALPVGIVAASLFGPKPGEGK
jgi:predicted tellurium resistance membrane protein TerC